MADGRISSDFGAVETAVGARPVFRGDNLILLDRTARVRDEKREGIKSPHRKRNHVGRRSRSGSFQEGRNDPVERRDTDGVSPVGLPTAASVS